MKRKINIVERLLILIFLLPVSSYAAKHEGLEGINSFTPIGVEKLRLLGSTQYASYFERNAQAFVVSKKDGVKVERRSRYYRINEIQRNKGFTMYDGGEYVGTYKGEFGGNLIYKNNDIDVVVLNENVISLIQSKNKIFVVTGHHHGFSTGAVYLIDTSLDPQKARLITLLPEAPHACTSTRGGVVCVGDMGLIRVSASSMYILFWSPEWVSFPFYQPNSIVASNGGYYIGLLGGVAFVKNLPLNQYKFDFLTDMELSLEE